jgi:hypothetical protein
VAIDVSRYRALLEDAGVKFGWLPALYNVQGGVSQFADENSSFAGYDYSALDNPAALNNLLDAEYGGRGANVNPYGALGARDALREVATKLGLTAEDADKAALDYALEQFNTYGQNYSEASHPAIIADQIAKRIFGQAGKPYEGLSDEENIKLISDATVHQNKLKEWDQDSWKRDEVIGGHIGAWTEQVQAAWESSTSEGWLPNERAFAGADNPWNTWFWNKVLNKDWDPYGNEVALPTKQNYQQAADQGYDVGAASLTNQVVGQVLKMVVGGTIGADAASAAESSSAAYIDPSYLEYAKNAKTAADYLKMYQQYRKTGDVNPGALFGAATGATKAIGDFDASGFTGSDSPFTSNSIFTDSQFGNNQAGGNNDMWEFNDYTGEWEYTDSVENQLDQYPADYGVDPYSDDYTRQLNEDFGGDSGGSGGGGGGGFGSVLSQLGGLLKDGSGLFSGISSAVGGTDKALAMAPILAAIQYARNQGPFDTSRLIGLSDRYNPDAMANTYDRNTEDQRRSLTSSLADRGVMGSSFGNMDITNFNTNRELGRGALISQASLGGADIAQKILQAQVQERQLRNQMYGGALAALGNVFGGKR